jgi:sigma-B regulation protein RsbU (phosphoserine phosphatase)
LFLLSAMLFAALWLAHRVVDLPLFLDVFRKVVSIAFIGSTAWLAVVWLVQNRRKLFWRVRRKLVLSYVFLGVVPVALLVLFTMFGGFVLYTNVTAYLFHEGLGDLINDVDQMAETAAVEIGRDPSTAGVVITRKLANLAREYPASLSLAVVSTDGKSPAISAGEWRHVTPPASVPDWVLARGFRGAVPIDAIRAGDDDALFVRAVVLTPAGDQVVIADLPLDSDAILRLQEKTGMRIAAVTVGATSRGQAPATGLGSLFRRTVAFMDATDWRTGASTRVSISLDAPLGSLYQRMAAVQSAQLGASLGGRDGFLILLVAFGVLCLVIQGSALFLGGFLARSITHAVHELFAGTEQVRQGDFTHRIHIESRDQLGDLADSFNKMSASIEHLLQVEREKNRLEDELLIARKIQQSLLPAFVPQMAGLSLADLCEPAREVGGDYYDFFDLGPRRLGVLVADVAGKGTSAALYMAELKGLMLALSQIHRSPRALLVAMNHLLADHLDNRSFITMIYAVIDLEAGTLTHARAGHTPLLIVSGGCSEVVIAEGMVLGLRLPGASERFQTMLQEHTRPIRPGDVVLLYTDGVTEAMNAAGDLFGDEALASVVAAHHTLDAPGIRERVLRDVKAFVRDAEPHDDMTMIVIKINDDWVSA